MICGCIMWDMALGGEGRGGEGGKGGREGRGAERKACDGGASEGEEVYAVMMVGGFRKKQ